MLNKIRNWFLRYDVEIGWFLTGWFSAYLLFDLSRGDLFAALIDLVIIVVNIAIWKR